MSARLAVVDTRLPRGTVFLIRDLTALIESGLVIDLFLLEPDSVDPGLERAVLAAGGTVNRMALPWSSSGAAAILREIVTRPHRVAGSAVAVLGIALRSPVEAMRHLVILPGSLAAARRARALGVTQFHGLWSGVPATACYWIRKHAGIPFSFSAHAWDLTRHTALHPAKTRAATGVTVCSEWGRRALVALAGEDSAARVHVVHHGLDLGAWSYRHRERPSDPALILGVGRLTRVKGFDALVRAAAALRDTGIAFRCEIVGSDERDWGRELRALIESLGLSGCVTLCGERPSPEVRELMSRADLLVCPFVDRESATSGSRGIPNVVPEAMALGTPVISTDAGGLTELVRDGETGRIVPQRDPAELARAMHDALRNWDATASRARRARELVETTHDLARTTRAFIDAIGLAG